MCVGFSALVSSQTQPKVPNSKLHANANTSTVWEFLVQSSIKITVFPILKSVLSLVQGRTKLLDFHSTHASHASSHLLILPTPAHCGCDGCTQPGKCLYTTIRELVENALDSAESISELPIIEIAM